MKAILFITVTGVLATASAVAQFEIARHTIDGGGAMNSAGGSFLLSGTIGQPDAGYLTGGSFELTGGFWFALAPGDCNEDGAVGLSDHSRFLDCLTGPGQVITVICACFDLDQNSVVDLGDFAEFQALFTTP